MFVKSECDRSAAFKLQTFRIIDTLEQTGRFTTSHVSAA
jgi:hypothetical protein